MINIINYSRSNNFGCEILQLRFWINATDKSVGFEHPETISHN